MWLKYREIRYIGFLEKNYLNNNMRFRCRTISRTKIIQSSWKLAQMYLLYIFRTIPLPKKIGPLRKQIFEIKNLKKIFESRFLREYLIYRFEILTSFCSDWRLYVFKIWRDSLHLFFRKKLFMIKFAFSWSHDNKSKNYPIVLNFDTDVSYIYLHNEFVAQKNRSRTEKDLWN